MEMANSAYKTVVVLCTQIKTQNLMMQWSRINKQVDKISEEADFYNKSNCIFLQFFLFLFFLSTVAIKKIISVIALPPCWIYNPINMAEDGRDERGKAEDDFYLRKEEWQFHYLEVAHAACNPTSTHFSPLSILWVLINTESMPFWTISSQGSYWSHPEKSIMLVFFY